MSGIGIIPLNALQISLIHEIMTASEELSLPLWLESGWAIDARLGRITREHEDIDLAFPRDRQDQFMSMLRGFGSGRIEETDYGFLVYVRDVLLDCEPCIQRGENYELEDVPLGSCPWEKQGSIEGIAVRCASWEAILWEYFYYLDEVPQASWRPKDFDSYATVRRTLGEARVEKLHLEFKAGRYHKEN